MLSSSSLLGMVSSSFGRRPDGHALSDLQVTVHEVDFLKPAQTLADVLSAQLSYSFD